MPVANSLPNSCAVDRVDIDPARIAVLGYEVERGMVPSGPYTAQESLFIQPNTRTGESRRDASVLEQAAQVRSFRCLILVGRLEEVQQVPKGGVVGPPAF